MTGIDTTAAAFMAGMVTSLHCVGMCGPLSCSWAISSRSGSAFFRDTSLYHLGRVIAYAFVGAAAGAIGTVPLRFFQHGAGLLLPWMIVVAFAVVGMGLDKYVPKPAFLGATVRRLQTRAMRMKSGLRAASLGLVTPLLPCGPLYLMFALAMVNGSATKGAGFLAAFALGTLPLLALAQFQLHWLGGRLSPVTMKRMQRGLALVTAVLLAWRLRGTLGPEGALSCCHGA
ncbi:MAG: sulfite exporter TauE/SafE family protein [Prosthecobacter sp.]|nr:sulfite exporter TauE/SafE family protein [Prosthecobacter sp.]